MYGAAPIAGIFLIVFITSLLGIVIGLFVFIVLINFLYKKYILKTTALMKITSKFKVLLGLAIILNTWNFYAYYKYYTIVKESKEASENKEKRSRFILPVDYKFDHFVFPKSTKINSNNIHDNGDKYRYLTLTGLEAAIFPHPVVIANVKAIAFKQDSHFSFLLQLSEDQYISPMYEVIHNGTNTPELIEKKNSKICKKGQIAEFFPLDEYYAERDYSTNDWITLEDEVFDPTKWRFKQCYTAPPIYLKAMYR